LRDGWEFLNAFSRLLVATVGLLVGVDFAVLVIRTVVEGNISIYQQIGGRRERLHFLRLNPGFDVAIRLATGLANNLFSTWDSDMNGCSCTRKRNNGSNRQNAHLTKGAERLKAKVALLGLIVHHESPPP
jgi:hypothetical protein